MKERQLGTTTRAKNTVKQAFISSLPVMAGYIVLGMGFGILLQDKGYTWPWALLMGVTIYAGSMQYVAVELLSGGATLISTALMTLMVDDGHVFYGVAMLEKYRDIGKKKFYCIFALCDETFSINCTADIPADVDRSWFYFFVSLLDQLYWISGALIGAVLGSFLHFNTQGLDFVMTAMFVVIFLEQWLKDRQHYSALIGLASAVACRLLFGPDQFLIPTMVCMLSFLTLFKRPIERKEAEE